MSDENESAATPVVDNPVTIVEPPAAAEPTAPSPRVESRIQVMTGDHGALVPRTFDEQLRVAKWACESNLVPTKTVAQTWMVMERGRELGFTGLAAFSVLYVVGGRVQIRPDAVKAKALASGLLEDAKEEVVGEGESMKARVTVKRKGIPTPTVGEFSVADARVAGLWGKTGRESGKPSGWVTHPKRMLKARARGFAYQDAFPDLVGGLPVREEFDLDPGEALNEMAPLRPSASAPPPGPDPIIAEVVGAAPQSAPPPQQTLEDQLRASVNTATKEMPPDPKSCEHAGIQGALARSGGRAVVCHECGEEVRPAKVEDWPVNTDAHARHGIAPADPAAAPADADFGKPPSASRKG